MDLTGKMKFGWGKREEKKKIQQTLQFAQVSAKGKLLEEKEICAGEEERGKRSIIILGNKQ